MVVAEKGADLPLPADKTPRAVEALLMIPQTPLKAFDQDVFIRGDPSDTAVGNDLQRLVADRSFRRPHAGGCEAEDLLEIVDAAPDLGTGVFRMAEDGRRQRDARHGGLGASDIAQKRQDWMVVWGDGQLHAPRLVQALVARDDGLQQFLLRGKQQLLVGYGEVFPFGGQFGKGRITPA